MILKGYVLCLLVVLSSCMSIPMTMLKKSATVDPDCFKNITELIASKGYPWEEHKVITSDGYILSVFRIPHGRNSSSSKPGPPVLLQHGLLDTGATWTINFPDQSLSYMLADAGYDVWIGNMRGSHYARAHTKYNPDHDEAFWDFSWDEMASIDLPSMIYYILNVTQHDKIGYAGHSQGGMIGFAEFGRLDSDVHNHISFWAALAPCAHLGHIKSPIRYLSTATVQKDLELYWHLLFGKNEFFPSNYIAEWLESLVCSEPTIDKDLCKNLYFLMFGPETTNLNVTRIPVYAAHEPGGTSVKNMIHYAQGVQSNTFAAYNYSTPEENMKHYNQTTAPFYSIRTLNVPTALFHGTNDWLADPVDVQFIHDEIPKESLVFYKNITGYDHADFIVGMTANRIIYDDVIRLMKQYHPLV